MSFNKTLIIDGNNIAMRNHFKLINLRNSKGKATGAIHGFLSTLLNLSEQHKPTSIVIAWDGGRAAWRRELYPDYKANRTGRDSEDSQAFFAQAADLRKICDHLDISTYHELGHEADDLIAYHTINSNDSSSVVIYSNDEDFVQLSSPSTKIFNPSTDRETSVLKSEYKCSALDYLFSKSIAGDSSDNIKGISGVGIKTALKVVRRIGPLSIHDLGSDRAIATYKASGKRWQDVTKDVFNNVILRNYHMMSLSYALTRLEKTPAPIVGNYDREKLLELLTEHELVRHVKQVDRFANLCHQPQ